MFSKQFWNIQNENNSGNILKIFIVNIYIYYTTQYMAIYVFELPFNLIFIRSVSIYFVYIL